MQRLVAITVLVGDDSMPNSSCNSLRSENSISAGDVADDPSNNCDAAGESGDATGAVHFQGKSGRAQGKDDKLSRGNSLSGSRGLFRYELIREFGSFGADGETDGGAMGGRRVWRSADGTHGIRVRLERLIASPPIGQERRGMRGLSSESNIMSEGGIVLEAVKGGGGSYSRTTVRVVSRGGADEPTPSGGGGGASSPAGDLLEYFVESVKLLATLCRERHTANIALVRSHKGTSYEVGS